MSICLLFFLLNIIFSKPPEGMELIWSDEFDGTEIDRTKWGFDIGTGGNGWGSNQLEYYTDRSVNAYVKDSCLHIRAQKEKYEGMNYTSARMKTEGKFDFQYGYVEARMKIPASMGIWPALWMMGSNFAEVNWPKCGEIDIMEAINDEYLVYGTCHWEFEGEHVQIGFFSDSYNITEFHNYSLEWDEEMIIVSVDGEVYFEMPILDSLLETESFHKPQFFLANVAVGGEWPGFVIDDSALPQELVIDYIRVYQYKD